MAKGQNSREYNFRKYREDEAYREDKLLRARAQHKARQKIINENREAYKAYYEEFLADIMDERFFASQEIPGV